MTFGTGSICQRDIPNTKVNDKTLLFAVSSTYEVQNQLDFKFEIPIWIDTELFAQSFQSQVLVRNLHFVREELTRLMKQSNRNRRPEKTTHAQDSSM